MTKLVHIYLTIAIEDSVECDTLISEEQVVPSLYHCWYYTTLVYQLWRDCQPFRDKELGCTYLFRIGMI